MDIAPHPHGLRPSGNHVDGANDGGRLFGALDDGLLAHLVTFVDDARDHVRLGRTCKRLYAFAVLQEDYWKDKYVSDKCDGEWRGTWRKTFLGLPDDSPAVSVAGVSSDLLYRPYLNAQIDLQQYLPTKRSTPIARFPDLSLEQFAKHTHHPFILERPVRQWPAIERWSTDRLLAAHGGKRFRAECVDWPLDRYVAYMRNNTDESPLYLFDARFGEKTGMDEDYTIPACMAEDIFHCLGHARPDYRWLIVGPARSGSTFHKDPNGTCAWNAVVSGSKYWIMLPPDTQVPGVIASDDGAEVTAPCSIAEWLMSYHGDARRTKGCVEGVCSAGEILYVPSGWWHLVVNLEDCVAVTQNFVPAAYTGVVWRFLRDRAEQVSGFRGCNPLGEFDKGLKTCHPDLHAKYATAADTASTSAWQSLAAGPTFSFNFADDD